jgi:hypothetical protein
VKIAVIAPNSAKGKSNMKKAKKLDKRPLSSKIRSGAFRAPMGGAGPHKDRKNSYKRHKRARSSPDESE